MFQTFFWEVGENRVSYIPQHWGYLPAKGGNNSLSPSGKKRGFFAVEVVW